MRMVDLIRSQQKEQREKSATPRPKEPAPGTGGQAEPDLDDSSEETSGLQEDPSKALLEDAAPLPEAPRIVAMADLIRSQQKEKSATPRPKKFAPRTGGQAEPELDTSEETSGLQEDTWKARLEDVPPLPEEPSIFAPGHADSPDELYAAAEETLGTIYQHASGREPLAIEPAAEMAERFAKTSVRENLQRAIKDSLPRPSTLMQQTLGKRDPGTLNLARKGLNVAIYALKLGDALGYPVTKLTELALAGMVHDIGLTWFPESMLTKPEPFSKNEREQIKEHALNGWEILRLLGPDWEWLADVTLQHHEREDGSGYPNGLGGDQIHEYAKIIGICDIYEAMAHGRAGRDGVTPIDALKEILQTERGRFSQTILRAFINGLSSYPVGSWVRLSSKEVGQVIATNKDNPLRPVLEVWYDTSRAKLPQPKVIDLNKEILLHITGPATEGARTK
ncbi:MAG: HD domain-containing protein [candidate division NC10 bacterium]|nr:HD domain-containing protein [candidate division NC10 bacterium]